MHNNCEMFNQVDDDIHFIKSLLPDHYQVIESFTKGSIKCVSSIGIKKNKDSEDEEHWYYIFTAIKQHFKERFQEVFHNVCYCHTNFTIYLK